MLEIAYRTCPTQNPKKIRQTQETKSPNNFPPILIYSTTSLSILQDAMIKWFSIACVMRLLYGVREAERLVHQCGATGLHPMRYIVAILNFLEQLHMGELKGSLNEDSLDLCTKILLGDLCREPVQEVTRSSYKDPGPFSKFRISLNKDPFSYVNWIRNISVQGSVGGTEGVSAQGPLICERACCKLVNVGHWCQVWRWPRQSWTYCAGLLRDSCRNCGRYSATIRGSVEDSCGAWGVRGAARGHKISWNHLWSFVAWRFNGLFATSSSHGESEASVTNPVDVLKTRLAGSTSKPGAAGMLGGFGWEEKRWSEEEQEGLRRPTKIQEAWD